MTIRRSAERWAFAAALLAIIAYAVADRDALVFMLGVPSAIAGWIVTRGSEARTPPRFVINLLLFVAVAWGTLSLFSEGLGVSLFSEFVASLVVIKIIDRRGCRDTAQILTLSTFLVIGAILTSNSFMLGVIVLVRIIDGKLKKGQQIRMMGTDARYPVDRVGVITPKMVMVPDLGPGEIGFITASIKEVADTRVGDTITEDKKPTAAALPGFKPAQPVVFCGIFPIDAADFEDLRAAVGKLRLNDASFSYEMESNDLTRLRYTI